MLLILAIGTLGPHILFLPMKWGSLFIAFQGGNKVAYHVGLGWAAYYAFMSSLAWVCQFADLFV